MTSILPADSILFSLSGQSADLSVFYSPLVAGVGNFALPSQSADLFTSCSLTAPAPPPPPPVVENEVIYTPVAPGVIFADLPVVTIIDTSPAEMIGCIVSTAENAQGRLNKFFPGASAGDGVIERRNGDIWVYSGSTWNNVGPNPGPTIQQTSSLILPYNEIADYIGELRIYSIVSKFEYALSILTEVDITTKAQVTVYRVKLLVAEVRNFLLAGMTANLIRRYKVIGGTGVFSVNGLSAGSIKGYSIGTNAGTFVSLGNTADLLIGRAISDVQAAVFDLTGQETGLEVLIAVSADLGEFTTAGLPGSLRKDSAIESSVAAYHISGDDAILVVTYLLAAGGDSFILLGQDAAISVVIELPADPGSFVLTGEEAGNLIIRSLTPEVGSYSLAGQSINIEVSDYFSSWGNQTYGYQSLIYPDWWAD